MIYQKIVDSDVFPKFKENQECLQNFLNSTDIPELANLTDLVCLDFKESGVVQLVNQGNIEGFIIGNKEKEVFIICPSLDYIRFWGFRNFFTYRLAKKHSDMNDGVLRYVINIHNKEDLNRVDAFNNIKNFKIYNLYRVPEDLLEWAKALFVF